MKLEEFLQIEGKKVILSNKISNGNACIRICNIRLVFPSKYTDIRYTSDEILSILSRT